eukprot:4119865-Prymnesium_polylepis.1
MSQVTRGLSHACDSKQAHSRPPHSCMSRDGSARRFRPVVAFRGSKTCPHTLSTYPLCPSVRGNALPRKIAILIAI